MLDGRIVSKSSEEMVETVKSIATKYGVTIEDGGGSYNPDNATLKFKVSTISESGSVNTEEANAYKMYARMYSPPENGLGKFITVQGKKYQILGLMPRSSKFPVLTLEVRTGKKIKFTTDLIKRSTLLEA